MSKTGFTKYRCSTMLTSDSSLTEFVRYINFVIIIMMMMTMTIITTIIILDKYT